MGNPSPKPLPKDVSEIIVRRVGTDRWHIRAIATPLNEAYVAYDGNVRDDELTSRILEIIGK